MSWICRIAQNFLEVLICVFCVSNVLKIVESGPKYHNFFSCGVHFVFLLVLVLKN